MLKLAIAGTGNVGKMHLGVFHKAGGVRIAAGFDADPQRLQDAMSFYGSIDPEAEPFG